MPSAKKRAHAKRRLVLLTHINKRNVLPPVGAGLLPFFSSKSEANNPISFQLNKANEPLIFFGVNAFSHPSHRLHLFHDWHLEFFNGFLETYQDVVT